MNTPLSMRIDPMVAIAPGTHAKISDCWNKIGVRGDSTCPQIEQYIHCRNCPVYSAAAAELLNVQTPDDYLDTWTAQVAQAKVPVESDQHSVLVFRSADEWLALPTVLMKEIANERAVHPIPHRRDGALLGVTNIRGELQVCISLRHMLGLDAPKEVVHAASPEQPQAHDLKGHERKGARRLLVMQREGKRAVCPVDEVSGVTRYAPRDLASVPATVARHASTYTKGVLSWQNKNIALLDDELLFHTINRSLA